jgi:hypothetical protein
MVVVVVVASLVGLKLSKWYPHSCAVMGSREPGLAPQRLTRGPETVHVPLGSL